MRFPSVQFFFHCWIFSFTATFIGHAQVAMGSDSNPQVVDASTMTGKVLCGYQGWFGTPGDGADAGWVHWGRGEVMPGSATFEMWPDMTDYSLGENYETGFKYPNGKAATVFSSQNRKTVEKHFQWMRDSGIDGVFLQRFLTTVTRSPIGKKRCDTVLSYIRESSSEYGRVYGLMYDLSGMKDGCAAVLMEDWKNLVDQMKFNKDDRYIHHRGKPVVALWGFGIEGDRDALLQDGLDLIKFFKNDPVYGGNCVMIGVPKDWRTLDTVRVPSGKMHELVKAADIVSPWAVGTASTLEDVTSNAEMLWKPDLEWCSANKIDYLPVVFPGFSWRNLKGRASPLNQIPRRGGRFLWHQYAEAKRIGATMVYQAMFDEVDEGTAIFKVTNNPPDGEGKSEFLTYEGLPSDFYLKLVGEATRLMRGEIGPEVPKLITSQTAKISVK